MMNHRIAYQNMLSAIRQVATAASLMLLSSLPVWGQASQVPNAKQQFIGPTGAAYDSGQVFMYVPNTFTKKSTWTGPDQGTQNVNPILLDAAGRAKIWGVGSYRQVLKDKNGLQVWDELTIAPPTSNTAATSGSGDFLPIGTVLPIAGYTAPVNYLLAYGQAVSRVTYPDALAALTISSAANCINTSATLTGIASTAQMRVGAPIEASCLASGTTIASIVSGTSVTVTPAATATGATTVQVFNWGNGDAVTTFNLPDLRGRVLPGADAMGGAAANRLGVVGMGASAAVLGVGGGGQAVSLATTNLPPYTPTGTIPAFTPSGTVTLSAASTGVVNSGTGGGANLTGGGAALLQANMTATFAGVLISPTFSGVAQGGVSTAFSVVQPSITINYVIKVLNGTLPIVGVLSLGGMGGDILCGSNITCANQTISLNVGTMAFQNSNNVSITGGAIACVNTPVATTDCANKAYVDSVASGLIILPPSRLATAAVLPNTPAYSNGAAGVGATLTAGSNTTLTTDGALAALNDIILVKNQTSQFQNGLYYVSTAGSGGAPWVLTRCTLAACGKEFDNAATMLAGSLTRVTAGATNANNAYVLQSTVTTVGTTAVVWNLFESNFTSVNTVATNAALKALAGGSSNAVIRTGYLAANDVPAATYVWNGASACTDDGGSCIQPNVGAGRWVLVAQPGPVPVGIFGAICNNVGGTDDKPAIQAAINYAQGVTGPSNAIQLPGSTCRFPTSGVTVTGNLSILGYGQSLSTINVLDCTITAISFNPVAGVNTWIVKQFSLNYPAPPTCAASGATAILMGNDTTIFSGSVVENVGIFSAHSGIYFNNGQNYNYQYNHIQKFWGYGTRIASVLLPDGGSVHFVGNEIEANGITVGSSIRWESSGGITFDANRIFGSDLGLDFALTGQTSEMQFTNNLMANQNTAMISMTRASSFLMMTEMLISHNVMDGANRALYIPADAFTNPTQWVNNLTFTNNQISSITAAGANEVTIFQTFGYYLGGNLFKCNNGPCGGRTMFVDASSDKGLVMQGIAPVGTIGVTEIGGWGNASIFNSTNTKVY